jgi:hypothetical protein
MKQTKKEYLGCIEGIFTKEAIEEYFQEVDDYGDDDVYDTISVSDLIKDMELYFASK